jgi:hypothetical protein
MRKGAKSVACDLIMQLLCQSDPVVVSMLRIEDAISSSSAVHTPVRRAVNDRDKRPFAALNVLG